MHWRKNHMFNLDLAVHQWCAQVLHNHAMSTSKMDELKDHLYSSIEERVAQGQTEQQAFEQSINTLGDSEQLREHFEADLTFFNKLCAIEYGEVGDMSPEIGVQMMKNYRKLMITNAILWAAAIIAVALITQEHEGMGMNITLLLTIIATMSVLSMKQIMMKKKD